MIYQLYNPRFNAEQAESLIAALVVMREAQMQSYAAPAEPAEAAETPISEPAARFVQPQLSCRVLQYPTGPFGRPFTKLDAHFAAHGIHPSAGPAQVKEDVLF